MSVVGTNFPSAERHSGHDKPEKSIVRYGGADNGFRDQSRRSRSWPVSRYVPLLEITQGRAGQVRDRRLERIEAVVERQKRLAPKGDDDGLVLD